MTSASSSAVVRFPPVLGPEATVAAFPLGGIGTGNVSIGSRGQFSDWELANRPDKGATLPFTFFAIHAHRDGGAPVTRVLESAIPGPHGGDQGYDAGRVAGLPRLASSRMRGEYPMLDIEFVDDELPVRVALSAFTPFVPLDAVESGIPGAYLRYNVANPGDVPVDVTIAGSIASPIGIVGYNVFHFPEYAGRPEVAFDDDGIVRGIRHTSDLAADHPLHGSAALVTADAAVTVKPRWLAAFWQDGVQSFWDDFSADGLLEAEPTLSHDDVDASALPPLRVGSLGIVHRLEPGETHAFDFIISWHFPNRPRAWQGNIGLDGTHAAEIVRNHYATRFDDAWQAARYLATNRQRLEGATRAFHDALFGSTLPPEVIDAASSNLAALRSTTCFRLEDGTFAAWEGSFEHAGSCEGTCTHVWNYAQAAAWLFPELERSARRVELLQETRPDGRMNFRANSVFGNEPWDFHPAVDGQLGTIVRVYREWRFSGDDEFLAELWPAVRRALEFAFIEWDSDGDGVLDSRQHNTYDIEFYGPNSLANSMFCAALAAAERMALHLDENEVAERYRTAGERCATRTDELLWGGEYYVQRVDDVDAYRYQYGDGCLSDQLFGQTLAHLAGLGHVLPAEHARDAVAAVFRHNFRRELSDHASVQRCYALPGEPGLLLCSWPEGGRPRLPFVYSDEVWTGVEYQVATDLIYEGFVDEALEIVRAVRTRHDGRVRSPWNEVECGNHYVRSMASWGLIPALSGADYDAAAQRLVVSPRLTTAGGFRSIVTTGSGWGEISIDEAGATLRLIGGALALDELEVRYPSLGALTLRDVRLEAGESARLLP